MSTLIAINLLLIFVAIFMMRIVILGFLISSRQFPLFNLALSKVNYILILLYLLCFFLPTSWGVFTSPDPIVKYLISSLFFLLAIAKLLIVLIDVFREKNLLITIPSSLITPIVVFCGAGVVVTQMTSARQFSGRYLIIMLLTLMLVATIDFTNQYISQKQKK